MRHAVAFLLILSLSGAPAASQKPKASQPVFIKEPHEIQMGRDADSSLIAARRLLQDSAWDHYLHDLGARLAATSERPGLPWTFRVLDDPVVNAFALPGGFVYVTRGMLAHLNSEAQLAGVLGHEIAHVSARHVADQSARLELERHGLVAVTTGGNLTGLAGDFIGTAILLGANSRQAEIEADQLGMQYMSQAGYDPMEMVSIIKMLDRTNHSLAAPDAGDTLPEWLITHPSPDRRIDALLRKRQELASAGTRIERDSYLARVDGLAYGPDVRPGFLKKRRFVAPGRGYQVTFPPDWLVSSVGTVVHGESQTHDAMLDLRAREEPTADSAARTFFHKQAKLRGVLAREQVGAVTLVQGQLSWMPYWVKVRGSVAFIESRGTVYQLLGLTTNGRWDDYGQLIEGALRTVELVPDSVVARAQPLRVATRSLREATSLSALVRLEGAPVGSEEMAMLNQVSADSVLPPGQIVKWIESPVH